MKNIAVLLLCFLPAITILAKKESILEDYEKNLSRFPNSSTVLVKSKQALIIDYDTGETLLSKNADDRLTPSSMTKMMTSFIIEEKLMNKELNPESSFYVDEEAWRTQGSKSFVPLGQMVKVSDLLRGITIQSGNDACIVAAKGIAGGIPQFSALMNAKAKSLGLKNTNFMNPHGLPEPNHYSTARDLATLGIAIIREHPEHYDIYKEKYFTLNNIKQGNRNPLLYPAADGSKDDHCDGIKTGHTEDGGFGAVLSCVNEGRRSIIVINGLSSINERREEAFRLKRWNDENFSHQNIIKAGDILDQEYKVKFAQKPIRLAAKKDVQFLTLRSNQEHATTKLLINENLQAPINKGDIIGKAVVSFNGNELETELISLDEAEKMGLIKRVLSYIGALKEGLKSKVRNLLS